MLFRRKSLKQAFRKSFEMSSTAEPSAKANDGPNEANSSSDVQTNPGSAGLYSSSPVGGTEGSKRTSLKGGRSSLSTALGQAKGAAAKGAAVRRASLR
jgi:hypothetical protein